MMLIDIFNCNQGIGDTLHVRVTPKAAANRIKVKHNPDGSKLVLVYVTVAAEDGKANAEVIRLLAKELGLPKSALSISRGLKSRDKIISIKSCKG